MLRYPLSDATDRYLGRIIFTPVVEKYLDVAKSASSTVSAITSGIDQFDTVSGAASAVGLGFGTSSGGEFDTKKTISMPSVAMTSYGQSASGPIMLYLPQAITISDNVAYETMNLGIIGASALNAVQQGSGVGAAIYKAVSDAGKSAIDLARGKITNSELAGLAAVRLANKIPNEGLRNAASAGIGVAVNPNTRQLFKQVSIREPSFTFKMVATSAAEAIAIKNIIKTFRTEMYPEDIVAAGVSVGYVFPNKFDIQLSYNGNQVATKFLRSYLRSVNTVYNPSSMGWHVKGEPSEVDITLNFVEARTLSKKDIRGGY